MSTTDGGDGGIAILDEPPVPDPEPTPTTNRRRLYIALAIICALLLIVISVFAWYLITRKPISELPGLNHEAMPSFKYSVYNVEAPLGVAVSADGERVYVTQGGGPRTVLAFDHAGNLRATLTPPASTGAAHTPVYVAINPLDGDVYVTDRLTKAIYVYTADGTYERSLAPAGLTGAWAPLGLAFDQSGNLYVTDVGGKVHRIVVLDPAGTVIRTIVPTDPPVSFPNGVAVDVNGTVIVTDGNNGRLLAFDRDGKVLATANRGIGDGDLGLPRGVTVDDSGRVFVVDTTNQTVHVYRLTGDPANPITFLGDFGDEGIADGLFEYPNGIATDSRSNVYVTDRENGRVQVWSF